MLLKRYHSGIEYVYKEPINLGMKKLIVAYEQHSEETLLEIWTKIQSPKPFAEWKKQVLQKTKVAQMRKRGRRGKAVITGPDLAQM